MAVPLGSWPDSSRKRLLFLSNKDVRGGRTNTGLRARASLRMWQQRGRKMAMLGRETKVFLLKVMHAGQSSPKALTPRNRG